MADKSVDMQATDQFAMSANFEEQSSTNNDLQDYATVQDADGDVAGGCEDAGSNKRNEYTSVYGYCGTDIVTDFGTFLTTFGEVQDSKAVTEIQVVFRLDAYPEVTVTGHNHDNNAHTALDDADLSGVIPASTGGIGCPDIWANADGDSDPTNVTVRFSLEHVDANDSDNEHWVGANKNFRVDVTAEYIGTPSLTTTNWKVDSSQATDSNSEFDGTTVAAHRFYARN